MENDEVKTALISLFNKHVALEQQKVVVRKKLQELESEDAKLQPKIVALAAALDEEVHPESPLAQYLAEIAAVGLTEGVRTVLRATDTCKTPMEIRDGLLRLGYELKGYSNVLASIHTILLRLIDKGEIEKVNSSRKGMKETGYLWKHESKQDSDLAKQLKKDLDYIRTEKSVDPLSKRY